MMDGSLHDVVLCCCVLGDGGYNDLIRGMSALLFAF